MSCLDASSPFFLISFQSIKSVQKWSEPKYSHFELLSSKTVWVVAFHKIWADTFFFAMGRPPERYFLCIKGTRYTVSILHTVLVKCMCYFGSHRCRIWKKLTLDYKVQCCGVWVQLFKDVSGESKRWTFLGLIAPFENVGQVVIWRNIPKMCGTAF